MLPAAPAYALALSSAAQNQPERVIDYLTQIEQQAAVRVER
jgi:hypothetical protein